jgi:sarcosine oxidase subunit alpha
VRRVHDAPGIDASRPVRFSFNGHSYSGFKGDTLASALLANGVDVVSRSLKFHRPRGLLAAGEEEAHAIVALQGDAVRAQNVMATEVDLFDGLSAVTQNAWPSARFDIGAILGGVRSLMPPGFYYKTFMWPNWRWYEPVMRRIAGLGKLAFAVPQDKYAKRYAHCETLIIGAGPAGLAAALSLRGRGERIVILDAGPELGGSLRWERDVIDGSPARDWLGRAQDALERDVHVRLLRNTTALGCYDGNMVSALERFSYGSQLRSCLWRIRAGRIVLATGAHERPMVFPDNDRPGIMLAASVRQYLNQYGVIAGRRVIVYTNNDLAYRTALDLGAHRGVNTVVVDVRADADGYWIQQVRGAGIDVLRGHAIVATAGRHRVRNVTVAPIDRNGSPELRDSRCIKGDLLAMSGGWSPEVHLWSQSGGSLKYCEQRVCIIPDQPLPAMQCIGAANGSFGLARCLAEGAQLGNGAPAKGEVAAEHPTQPFWYTPRVASDRQWVDFLHDVTLQEIEIAVREGFTSVEHLKRYTTVGMSIDQGKTSNVNALAILGTMTSQPIGQVGTTRFRPPYAPVAIGALAGNRVDALATRYRRLPVAWHETNGGVLEDHSGWLRPACYRRPGESEEEAIRREVQTARNAVVLFDSSSLGKIEVRGRDAATLLTRCYVNNVKSLQVGRVRYGLMLNDQGVIVDDGVFARLAADEYIVITSSSGALDTAYRLEEYLQCEWSNLQVNLTVVTNQWATLALSGPQARAVLQGCSLDLAWASSDLPHLHVGCGTIEGIPLRLFRVSFTGETCFELNVPADSADALWRHLMEVGSDRGIAPLGMEALDILRIEKGFLEVGVDTDTDTTPLDVGWANHIAKKSDDFLGRRSLALLAPRHPDRHQLVGFTAEDPELTIPAGTHLLADDGVQGHITSSCQSPTLGRCVGMALVRSGRTRLGSRIEADIEGRRHVVRLGPCAHYDLEGRQLHG